MLYTEFTSPAQVSEEPGACLPEKTLERYDHLATPGYSGFESPYGGSYIPRPDPQAPAFLLPGPVIKHEQDPSCPAPAPYTSPPYVFRAPPVSASDPGPALQHQTQSHETLAYPLSPGNPFYSPVPSPQFTHNPQNTLEPIQHDQVPLPNDTEFDGPAEGHQLNDARVAGLSLEAVGLALEAVGKILKDDSLLNNGREDGC